MIKNKSPSKQGDFFFNDLHFFLYIDFLCFTDFQVCHKNHFKDSASQVSLLVDSLFKWEGGKTI